MLEGTGCCGKEKATITDSVMMDVYVIERRQGGRVGKADSRQICKWLF